MKAYGHIKETRREFIREKRRNIREADKALRKLRSGCACWDIFDGTNAFQSAVRKIEAALAEMNRITKPLV